MYSIYYLQFGALIFCKRYHIIQCEFKYYIQVQYKKKELVEFRAPVLRLVKSSSFLRPTGVVQDN